MTDYPRMKGSCVRARGELGGESRFQKRLSVKQSYGLWTVVGHISLSGADEWNGEIIKLSVSVRQGAAAGTQRVNLTPPAVH